MPEPAAPKPFNQAAAVGVALIVLLFLAGLGCLLVVFHIDHQEGDEHIYRALVQQLNWHHGYTLQGHFILRLPWIDRGQYDHPLFYHPPGGIAYFWLWQRLAGNHGWGDAQVISYVLFFGGTLLLAGAVLEPWTWTGGVVAALLASTSPIMGHVTDHYWLDGPLLAFATVAAAVFLWGVRRHSWALVVLGGVLLGYASWIKLTALTIAPGMVLLAWAVTPPRAGARRRSLLMLLACLGIAGLIQLPWEIWQWRVEGSPFPSWAGKPSAHLVATDPYIHYVTVVVSPWIYVTQLPLVLWTLVPSLLLLAWQWRNRALCVRGLALTGWIAAVLAAHIALGYMGYSRLLRYVVLVSPATVVLGALTFAGIVTDLRRAVPGRARRAVAIAGWVLVFGAVTGMAAEVVQGIKSGVVDTQKAVMAPLWKR